MGPEESLRLDREAIRRESGCGTSGSGGCGRSVPSPSSAVTIGCGNVDDLEFIQRTAGHTQGSVRDVEVPRGRLQVAMAEEKLNRAQVGARFEQMRRPTMASMPHAA